MELPSGFETRLQEMTNTLQQRKQVLEAERQLQSARRTTLQEANANLEQIQQLTSAMRNKADAVSSEINRLEKNRSTVHVQLEDILYKSRMLAEQIIALEQEKEETSRFYEKNKEEMETYEKKFEEQNLSLENEINDLQKQYDELKRSESEREKQICELDAAIAEEEEKQIKLVSMHNEVINEIATNSINVEKLEATVRETTEELRQKQQELEATLSERRNEIILLHRQHQYWESKVYQHIETRTHMQRELEKLENRIAQTSKALFG